MKNQFPRMHISLYVSDISKTVQFYTDFFGQTPVKTKPNYAKFILDQPSLIISFVENPERVQQNFGHLGFQVENQDILQKHLENAKMKNLVAKIEMGTACCYAVQDKFWVNDPDGIQWEVYYFHEDADFNDPHFELNDATACCMPENKIEKPVFELQKLGIINNENSCTTDSGCC